MEKRKINISYTKSGSGSRSTRIVLPVKWVDLIEVTPEDREVFIYRFGDNILIKKIALEWNYKEAVAYSLEDIKKIIRTKNWIDLEEVVEIIETTLTTYFENDKKTIKNKFNSLFNPMIDWLEKNSNEFTDSKKSYYCDKNFEFKSFIDFKTYFIDKKN